MGITILGNVGKIIEDNHGEMYFDNAKKILGTNENTKSHAEVQDAQVMEEVQEIDMSLFSSEHVPAYIEQEIKQALEAVKGKAERAKAMYALQERGLINLDQYHSDAERAKHLNWHQNICQFSTDSVLRGRQLWEEA